jgi:hypothetical protein
MDIPDTILSGDVDQGNLATAKTLDRPTELGMLTEQALWTGVFRDLGQYVIRSHIVATRGQLQGTVTTDADGIETIMLTQAGPDDDIDPLDIDVTFPPILEHDIDAAVQAIVSAATLDGKTNAHTLDNKTLVRLLLTALDVDDQDELIDQIVEALDAADAEPKPEPPAAPTVVPAPVAQDQTEAVRAMASLAQKLLEEARS